MEEHTEPGSKKKKVPYVETGLIALIVILLGYKLFQKEDEKKSENPEPLVVKLAQVSTPEATSQPTVQPTAVPTSVPTVRPKKIKKPKVKAQPVKHEGVKTTVQMEPT